MQLEFEETTPARMVEPEYQTGREAVFRVTTTTWRPWSEDQTATRRSWVMTFEELAELAQEDGDAIVGIEPYE